MDAGTFPDPKDCSGFVQCAQSTAFPKKCNNGLFFDPVSDILTSLSHVLATIVLFRSFVTATQKQQQIVREDPLEEEVVAFTNITSLIFIATAGSSGGGGRRGKQLPGFDNGGKNRGNGDNQQWR